MGREPCDERRWRISSGAWIKAISSGVGLLSLAAYQTIYLPPARAAATPGLNQAVSAQREPGASRFEIVATIKELMSSTVDPAADGVWDSVAVTSSKAGIVKHEPRTPAEWQEVRGRAITLIESMNLVVMKGRHAAPPGTQPKLGELSPKQIDALIASNPQAFAAFADQVRDSAREALHAIDNKDVKALFKAGGDIDQSCESCHVAYWYPNQPRAGH